MRRASRQIPGAPGWDAGLETTTMNDLATDNLTLGDVPATALMTLACRVAETRSAAPILRDPLAVDWLARLKPRLQTSGIDLHERAARLSTHPETQVYVALRAREFDRLTQGFLGRHPGGTVATLGCGFDTRFDRLQGSGGRFFDLDTPEIIGLRRGLPGGDAGAAAVAGNVMDFGWMDAPALSGDGPVLFLAEGLFMYLENHEVEALAGEMCRRFPGAELVCEVFNSFWLDPLRRGEVERKLMAELCFGPGAMFCSGVADAREIAAWGDGIEILKEWMHLDEDEPKLGRLAKLRHFPRFRRRQWVVHGRLGGSCPPASHPAAGGE